MTSGVNTQCLLVDTLTISVALFAISSRRGFEYSSPFRVGRGGRALLLFLKSVCVSVGHRSHHIQRTKNSGFAGNKFAVVSDGNGSTGYEAARRRYLGNLLSELRSDQTRPSYSRKTEKRVFDFRRCTVKSIFFVRTPFF